jgi:adenylosuccinate synthase
MRGRRYHDPRQKLQVKGVGNGSNRRSWAQWGDEGKGRIIDWLASEADLVIRCQGGANAGHTVINEWGKTVLHQIPSGIFHSQVDCLIGAGSVVNPERFLAERDELRSKGMPCERLWISDRAHVVFPHHLRRDEREEIRRREARVGTTLQGVGPAYVDKVRRIGVQAGDLADPDVVRERLALAADNGLGIDAAVAWATAMAQCLAPHVRDAQPLIDAALSADRRVLLEGQLGVMRDLDWGAYPFVTASSPSAAGLCLGAGLPPRAVTDVIGVAKVYTTAVGEGPFPTELEDATGDRLRAAGEEFGATTGRPRRCGWFDAVAVGYAARINGFTRLALTKLDVLSGVPELRLATAYQIEGRRTTAMPRAAAMAQAVPEYETLPGWDATISSARSWEELPGSARRLVERIEALCNTPAAMLSVGPSRESLVLR